jgi:hypothetical protein
VKYIIKYNIYHIKCKNLIIYSVGYFNYVVFFSLLKTKQKNVFTGNCAFVEMVHGKMIHGKMKNRELVCRRTVRGETIIRGIVRFQFLCIRIKVPTKHLNAFQEYFVFFLSTPKHGGQNIQNTDISKIELCLAVTLIFSNIQQNQHRYVAKVKLNIPIDVWSRSFIIFFVFKGQTHRFKGNLEPQYDTRKPKFEHSISQPPVSISKEY